MTHPSEKLNASDVKVFVPALNYDQSLKFYTLLGWQLRWQSDNGELAELELADCRFYLQNYYVKDWANNFMFHVTVTDAQAWHDHVTSILEAESFDHARLKPPEKTDYGALVTYVWDPSGVLIHFAEFLNQ